MATTHGMVDEKSSLITINNQTYRKIKSLGKGRYGETWLYQTTTTPPQHMAVKIKSLESNDEEKIAAFLKAGEEEAGYIKKVYGFSEVMHFSKKTPEKKTTTLTTHICMPYLPGPTLEQFVIQNEFQFIDTCLLLFSTLKKQIHSKKIVHSDISPSNIIISDAKQANFIDLGFASTHRLGVAKTFSRSEYHPPELIKPADLDPKLIKSKKTQPDFNQDLYCMGRTVQWKYQQMLADRNTRLMTYPYVSAQFDKFFKGFLTEPLQRQNIDNACVQLNILRFAFTLLKHQSPETFLQHRDYLTSKHQQIPDFINFLEDIKPELRASFINQYEKEKKHLYNHLKRNEYARLEELVPLNTTCFSPTHKAAVEKPVPVPQTKPEPVIPAQKEPATTPAAIPKSPVSMPTENIFVTKLTDLLRHVFSNTVFWHHQVKGLGGTPVKIKTGGHLKVPGIIAGGQTFFNKKGQSKTAILNELITMAINRKYSSTYSFCFFAVNMREATTEKLSEKLRALKLLSTDQINADTLKSFTDLFKEDLFAKHPFFIPWKEPNHTSADPAPSSRPRC